jgi:hypothetical protein
VARWSGRQVARRLIQVDPVGTYLLVSPAKPAGLGADLPGLLRGPAATGDHRLRPLLLLSLHRQVPPVPAAVPLLPRGGEQVPRSPPSHQAHTGDLRPDRTAEAVLLQWAPLLAALSAAAAPAPQQPAAQPVETSTDDSFQSAIVELPVSQQTPSLESSRSAACPLCYVAMAPQHLSRHRAECEARQAAPAPAPRPVRPSLPKLVYALLKDPELRRRCTAH